MTPVHVYASCIDDVLSLDYCARCLQVGWWSMETQSLIVLAVMIDIRSSIYSR